MGAPVVGYRALCRRLDRYVLLCAFRVNTDAHHADALLRNNRARGTRVPGLLSGLGPHYFKDGMDTAHSLVARYLERVQCLGKASSQTEAYPFGRTCCPFLECHHGGSRLQSLHLLRY